MVRSKQDNMQLVLLSYIDTYRRHVGVSLARVSRITATLETLHN